MARLVRAIQFLPDPKLDGPDKPGHDDVVVEGEAMTFTVQHVKHRASLRPAQDLQRQLDIALRALLTPATFCFAVPDAENPCNLPRLALIHGGRTLCLELKAPHGRLTSPQRAAHVALRAAGARVEVARSLPEALAHIRGFGIPLRDVSLRSIFRSAA